MISNVRSVVELALGFTRSASVVVGIRAVAAPALSQSPTIAFSRHLASSLALQRRPAPGNSPGRPPGRCEL